MVAGSEEMGMHLHPRFQFGKQILWKKGTKLETDTTKLLEIIQWLQGPGK